MEMTDNMKRSVAETLQKAGIEPSDELLEKVTGGRRPTSMYEYYMDAAWESMEVARDKYMRSEVMKERWKITTPEFDIERMIAIFKEYEMYLYNLPQDSPVVLFQDTELYNRLWDGT